MNAMSAASQGCPLGGCCSTPKDKELLAVCGASAPASHQKLSCCLLPGEVTFIGQSLMHSLSPVTSFFTTQEFKVQTSGNICHSESYQESDVPRSKGPHCWYAVQGPAWVSACFTSRHIRLAEFQLWRTDEVQWILRKICRECERVLGFGLHLHIPRPRCWGLRRKSASSCTCNGASTRIWRMRRGIPVPSWN